MRAENVQTSVKKAVIIAVLLISACATDRGKRTIVEVENKGSGMGIPVPDWVKTYVEKGVSALQAQYQDSYCIVGEETGANRQFVLAWADQASAQQRIGSLLRGNIEGRFHAAISATDQSGAGGESSGRYQQEIDTILNTVVNVSYSGARREADWWSLRRRYDPDNKGVYADEYTAYVLYTVPKAEMNRQIAFALETGVSKDSVLYDITISLARDILLQGYDQTELAGTAAIEQTAAASYDPLDSPTTLALEEISFLDTYGIGRDIAAAILSSYKLWNADPRLTSYVNLICAAIVINSPSPLLYNGYHVAILDTDEINAFATPGGHIFITRGLIAAADSEDALAAVIAHEIAHIQLNHGLRAIQSNRGVEDWFSQFTSSGAQEIIGAINNGFSQIQEFDADITALSLLAAAGYSPQGLPDMLRELRKIQSGTQGGFNQTHPSPESRLVNAQIAIARYLQAPDTRRYRQARFTALK